MNNKKLWTFSIDTTKNNQMVKQQHDTFKSTTKNFFNNEFKGFEFKLEKKSLIIDTVLTTLDTVASKQSDLTNLISGSSYNDKGKLKTIKVITKLFLQHKTLIL